MLFSYVFEQLIEHIIDILMWVVVAFGFSRGDRGWLIVSVIVVVVLLLSYTGQIMGSATEEQLLWMLISAVIGIGTGVFVGRRTRRRALSKSVPN